MSATETSEQQSRPGGPGTGLPAASARGRRVASMLSPANIGAIYV